MKCSRIFNNLIVSLVIQVNFNLFRDRFRDVWRVKVNYAVPNKNLRLVSVLSSRGEWLGYVWVTSKSLVFSERERELWRKAKSYIFPHSHFLDSRRRYDSGPVSSLLVLQLGHNNNAKKPQPTLASIHQVRFIAMRPPWPCWWWWSRYVRIVMDAGAREEKSVPRDNGDSRPVQERKESRKLKVAAARLAGPGRQPVEGRWKRASRASRKWPGGGHRRLDIAINRLVLHHQTGTPSSASR